MSLSSPTYYDSPGTSQENLPQSICHPRRPYSKCDGRGLVWPRPDPQSLLRKGLPSCRGSSGPLLLLPGLPRRRYSSRCSFPARYRLRNSPDPLRHHRLDDSLLPLSHLPSLVTLHVRNGNEPRLLSSAPGTAKLSPTLVEVGIQQGVGR